MAFIIEMIEPVMIVDVVLTNIKVQICTVTVNAQMAIFQIPIITVYRVQVSNVTMDYSILLLHK
jgi:hypothetical protein